jgi:CheY-like chemotaxis protein
MTDSSPDGSFGFPLKPCRMSTSSLNTKALTTPKGRPAMRDQGISPPEDKAGPGPPAQAVMVVDDDDAIRTSLKEFLEDAGFRVLTARDGAEALDILKVNPAPGVILLDFMMPVMNGSQFLTAKWDYPHLRGIPIVILSAWIREWTGQAVGVDHVLTKPINTDLLLEIVTRYCQPGERKSRQG